MKLRKYDLGWVVALIEAEGCISVTRRKSGRPYPRLTVQMTDWDVIEELWSRLDLRGHMTGPYRYGDRKPVWHWKANGAEAIEIIKMVLPYLGMRRAARAREVIEMWEGVPK